MKQEEINTNDYLKGIVLNLPESPGIYQYLDTEGTIIYVGKAKNLKRRVSSYFNREHPNGKTRVLVSKIADIRYIVVKTEEDALLLENNLIKTLNPKFNILFRDDKSYPYLMVSGGEFPRLGFHRGAMDKARATVRSLRKRQAELSNYDRDQLETLDKAVRRR
jgi:excinuclease ABC subunit C